MRLHTRWHLFKVYLKSRIETALYTDRYPSLTPATEADLITVKASMLITLPQTGSSYCSVPPVPP